MALDFEYEIILCPFGGMHSTECHPIKSLCFNHDYIVKLLLARYAAKMVLLTYHCLCYFSQFWQAYFIYYGKCK